MRAIRDHLVPFRLLGSLLGSDSPHAEIPAAWIEDRESLTHRKWSPVTMAALDVARQAIADAGWSPSELEDAALIVGTSRGNAAGWLAPWPGRRPFKLMAASNTIHSEPATAISIEFGIAGPSHVLASGCAAGLDALSLAALMVQSGVAPRALAVAVDLPLVPLLLDNYRASGLLSTRLRSDPYDSKSHGFTPGEAAAAIAIGRPNQASPNRRVRILYHGNNSDAKDPVGVPRDGGRTPQLLKQAITRTARPQALCPHATGTLVQATAETAGFTETFSPGEFPSLHVLKPYLGHTIGASGLVESAILTAFLRDRQLPPNLPGLHAPQGFELPSEPRAITGIVFKLSHGMGGHNTLIAMSNDA